jgi:hypothetical protein
MIPFTTEIPNGICKHCGQDIVKHRTPAHTIYLGRNGARCSIEDCEKNHVDGECLH